MPTSSKTETSASILKPRRNERQKGARPRIGASMLPTTISETHGRSSMCDNNTGTGGQWDDPMSKSSQDTTSGRGRDTYGQQNLGQSSYNYGSNIRSSQTGTGLGSTDTQLDQYVTLGQYGSLERATTGQTSGYMDLARNVAAVGGGRRPNNDDEYGASVGPGGGPMGKPSMASRVMGQAGYSVCDRGTWLMRKGISKLIQISIKYTRNKGIIAITSHTGLACTEVSTLGAAEHCRKGVEDIDSWIKPLGQPVVNTLSPRLLKLLDLVLKHSENVSRRITAVEVWKMDWKLRSEVAARGVDIGLLYLGIAKGLAGM
ncbi:hypothetical protein H4582DRAFT_2051173 [Lactarius indigo]|nr:hypothetical protein H4582DRAFT_2051173 [Lactarius indigo]